MANDAFELEKTAAQIFCSHKNTAAPAHENIKTGAEKFESTDLIGHFILRTERERKFEEK